MKMAAQKIMAGTMALACLALGAGGLHAQVTEVLTIKTTALVQGGSSSSYDQKTGITTHTSAAPTKHRVTTKDLLALLAADYNITFPSGAKLVIAADYGRIEIVDKNNNVLQDVSDIIRISNGVNDIFSSKHTNQYISPVGASGGGILPFGTILQVGTFTGLQLLTIKYDDTVAGGRLMFFLTGICTGKSMVTTPNKTTGAYTESISGSLNSGTGEGSYQGNPFVCTGTASESGKATLNINNSGIGSPGGNPGGFTITTH
jgi:hypothetical protein